MTRNRKGRIGGFTLIELVIVIAIIGILASVAMPRFVALQRDARVAKLNAARGSVGAAAALVHGAYLARQNVADTVGCAGNSSNVANNTSSLCSENGLIAISHGYPASTALGATPPGIVEAAGLASAYNPNAAALAVEGYAVVVSAGVSTTFEIKDAPTPANCSFIYDDATSTSAAVIGAPTTSGC